MAALGPARFVRFAAARQVQVRRPLAERLVAAARDTLPTCDAVVARRVLAADLRLLRELEQDITATEQHLAILLPDTPFRTLTTVPGWGVVRAANYAGALGDPDRWPGPRQIYRASGLSPAQYESAGRKPTGGPAHLYAAPGLFLPALCEKLDAVASRDLTRADPAGASALGESRSRVLGVLQAARTPVGVDEIAERVRRHPNTTRFHLDGLVEAGLAARGTEDRELPGRPRALYTATSNSAPTGRRSYRLLAEILTSYLANETKNPRQAALKAGEAWGRFLTERPAPFCQVDGAGATRQLVETLDDIGFAPEAVTTGRKRRILLHHCPFRETAEQHGEVVCSIHLGLMQGMLSELDAPLEAQRLDPFVEPTVCVVHLAARSPKTDTARRRAS